MIRLFDQFGRRIPSPGLRVHPDANRGYFRLEQPEIRYHELFRNMRLESLPMVRKEIVDVWDLLWDRLGADPSLKELRQAVHLPFLCPPQPAGMGRGADLARFVGALAESFKSEFPGQVFRDLCQGKLGDNVVPAPGSRYEQFEAARRAGWVVGWYFPNCLPGFDLTSQRAQMTGLPGLVNLFCGKQAAVVLSGAVDAVSAISSTPKLLFGKVNEEHYPHHLCLSGLKEPGEPEPFVYTLEAYGRDLVFRYRSNFLTPTVMQVSEQWAGGLTVYTTL